MGLPAYPEFMTPASPEEVAGTLAGAKESTGVRVPGTAHA
jgi:hypothetical protein